MSLDKHPPELLRRALEILGTNGERWVKGRWREVRDVRIEGVVRKTTCFCAEGAIAAANRPILEDPDAKQTDYITDHPKGPIETAAVGVLRQVVGRDVPGYNDHQRREWLELKEKFEAAIVKAEARVAEEQNQAAA